MPPTPPAAPPAAVVAAPQLASTAYVAEPSPVAPVVLPAPVPAPAASVTSARVCPRCRGTSDGAAQFCRFCGAALGPPGAPGKPTPTPAASVPLAAPPGAEQAPALWRPAVPVGFPVPASAPPAAVPAAASPLPPAAPPAQPAAVDARQTAAQAATLPTYGRIVLITKEGAEGASYPVRENVDIGRAEGEVVIADDRYLSPRHARLTRRSEVGKAAEFVLVDLASTNGVYLRLGRDGVAQAPLEDQDLFLVGQQVLKFDVVRDAEEGLAPATQHGTLLFGTPSGPRYARLSQRTVEGIARDVFHVQKPETVIGRESGDIVFTDDPFLSRRHAVIKFDPAARRFLLADLGSSNGTFVQIRGQVTIRSGDQFRIGQQLFRVDLSSASAP